MNSGCILPCFVSAALLAACSSPSSDWLDASATDTIGAYQTFLKRYPADPHAPDASQAILRLRDDQAWAKAQSISSVEGLQAYLDAEPHGAHAKIARDNMTARWRAWKWQLLQPDPTADKLKVFLADYPSGPEADLAKIRLQKIAGYRAEFADVNKRSTADHVRSQLAHRFGKVVPEVTILPPDDRDGDYRVTSAPMSEQGVNQVCDQLTSRGQACWITRASS